MRTSINESGARIFSAWHLMGTSRRWCGLRGRRRRKSRRMEKYVPEQLQKQFTYTSMACRPFRIIWETGGYDQPRLSA
jgi:hypothetical protein